MSGAILAHLKVRSWAIGLAMVSHSNNSKSYKYSEQFYFAIIILNSLTLIISFQEHLWIDRGTRAVIVDFTVYNGNLNVFTLVKLVVAYRCFYIRNIRQPFDQILE